MNPQIKPDIPCFKQPKSEYNSIKLPYNIDEVSKNPFYELIKSSFKQDHE
jgi:hypothetical protein